MDANTVLEFVQTVGTLKHIPRSGWQIRGIANPESVADHCFRMSLLAMLLADLLVARGVELDANRVLRMATLHELAESRIGDIPYPALRYIDAATKHAAEHAAVADLLAGFGPVGERYQALWLEFEARDTLEARLVNAADKLEMMIQAGEYERAGWRGLDEFWRNTDTQAAFDAHPFVREIIGLLAASRAQQGA